MTYVLSDIHGNLQRFESIMAQINLQADDTLYVLGDVIDRYAGGIKILRQIPSINSQRAELSESYHLQELRPHVYFAGDLLHNRAINQYFLENINSIL